MPPCESNIDIFFSLRVVQRGEPLAREIRHLFPWVKVVMILREPISRLISYTRMYTERGNDPLKGCMPDQSLFDCLSIQFGELLVTQSSCLHCACCHGPSCTCIPSLALLLLPSPIPVLNAQGALI